MSKSDTPIWITEPRYCKWCGEQIIPTYKMARTRWRSGRVKYCSRSCLARDTRAGKSFWPLLPEHRARISKARKAENKWVGKDNPNYGGHQNRGRKCPEHLKELNRKRMFNGGAAIARRAQGGKRSSIEIAIEKVLIKHSIPFIPQYRIKNHCVDFFISPTLVIECDGDYWHSLPEQQRRDKQNNAMLTKMGYKILRLQEKEIRANLDCCEKKILSFVAPRPF